MAQTKFDKQVEETTESVAFGIGRFLAGRPTDGERKTDATFWRSGTRVLPKVEGRVLVAAGQDNGDVLARIENLKSGKVLEIAEAQETPGAVAAQRAYEGDDARHQHWRLIPVGSATDTPQVYEIANRNSGLLLRVDTNAPTAIKQHGAEGDQRDRQWQMLPV